MSKTLIVQSYRTSNVPKWIEKCMESVQKWANRRHYEYRRIGDSLFDLLPENLRELNIKRAGDNIFYPLTDLARLELMDMYIRQYSKVCWIDADVLVFDIDIFSIKCNDSCAFSHEVFSQLKKGEPRYKNWSINNTVIVADSQSEVFKYYLYVARALLQQTPLESWSRTMIGPSLLNRMNSICPLERITTNGLVFGAISEAIVANDVSILQVFARLHEFKMGAANLCHFETRIDGQIHDRSLEVVETLLRTKGQVFNEYVDNTESTVKVHVPRTKDFFIKVKPSVKQHTND